MTLIEALISGLAQGVTEFLPVSSSAHLVLIHNFFGLKENNIFFDICLHAATLGAVVVFFREDLRNILRNKNYKIVLYLFLGTIPAVLMALFFEEKISSFFMFPRKVGLMMMVTALMLFFGQRAMMQKKKYKKIGTRNALIVGLAQAIALFPGISRSGATISTAIAVGIEKEEAFRFSFLLSIPAVLGAVVYKIVGAADIGGIEAIVSVNYLAGIITAFAVALASLHVLELVIRAKRLYIFGIYCFVLGTTVLLFVR
ncbi:MAG: undecaprenyl-diphosphate phosphatase [Candidatus Omnitrophota bacterium]